jgi:phospholipid transport system substrate-binding protein
MRALVANKTSIFLLLNLHLKIACIFPKKTYKAGLYLMKIKPSLLKNIYMNFMRKSAFYFLLCIALSFTASGALAAGENARDFIQNIGNNVISIVSDAKLNDGNKEQKLSDLFVDTVDIDWIGKFVVGRYWRESSHDQQEKYIDLYKKFLINSYVSKFRKYTDQKMTISKFSMEVEGDYLVETSIIDQDGKVYKVDYKVRTEVNGKLAIYDIIAEGVSMITTQRSEFASILSREGMDALIAKLAERKS